MKLYNVIVILHTLPDYKDVISWKDILKLAQQLQKSESLDIQITRIYHNIDMYLYIYYIIYNNLVIIMDI